MQYISTRDNTSRVSAAQAISRGISAEGGLFVPEKFPLLTAEELSGLVPLSYVDRSAAILSKYLTDFSELQIRECVVSAYGNQFDTPTVAPLKDLGDGHYLLELWHGPTCAFKDMALQILPHLMRVSVEKTAPGRKIVILVATSGDTGKAALEGFRDAEGTRILVFYPEKGVSAMQKLQMTTQEGKNVGVCAVRGNFDDAQAGVKTLFTDPKVARRLDEQGMQFSSANSINWGRLLPQIVYYVSAYCDLLHDKKIGVGDPINVVVPTGNFGNILAAYYASRMGVPIKRFICASNRNRVLTDFLTTGIYDCNRPFFTTTSPSMDILVSSNLERLLYHLSGNNDAEIRGLMSELKEKRKYTVPEAVRQQLDTLFAAGSADDGQVSDTIRGLFEKQHYLCDTHTAVALHVYEDYRQKTGDTTPTVIASTANPYKFTSAVLNALGHPLDEDSFMQMEALKKYTGCPIPRPLAALSGKAIRFTDSCEKDKNDMETMIYRLLHIG